MNSLIRRIPPQAMAFAVYALLIAFAVLAFMNPN